MSAVRKMTNMLIGSQQFTGTTWWNSPPNPQPWNYPMSRAEWSLWCDFTGAAWPIAQKPTEFRRLQFIQLVRMRRVAGDLTAEQAQEVLKLGDTAAQRFHEYQLDLQRRKTENRKPVHVRASPRHAGEDWVHENRNRRIVIK